jgi:hypothetical protein
MSAFSWKALRDQLAVSSYLMPDDDITSQRGLIATAIAIAERMSNSENTREVTWKPVRLTLKPVSVTLDSSVVTPKPSVDDDKGLKVETVKPLPRKSLSPLLFRLQNKSYQLR